MMAEKYDKNGYAGSDFKRNAPLEHVHKVEHADLEQDGDDSNVVADKAGEYMRELLGEKLKIDQQKFPISIKLIDQEVSRVQSLGRVPTKEFRYVDIYREKPIKVSVKVLVPVREHPKFNFVGKLLGPKGNSMKRLQEETMCKMAVLGRGSMKDRQKEEELRQALDPKYAHLSDDLHVEISALGPPAEAHARIAFALAEVRKYLIPDSNDIIRQEQLRMLLDPALPPPVPPKPPMPPRFNAPQTRYNAPHSLPPTHVSHRGGGGVRGGSGVRNPQPSPRVMPAKTKIMSILDKARVAMEETYGYEEGYEGSPGGRDEDSYYYEEAPPPPHIHPAEYPPHHYPPPHHRHRGEGAPQHAPPQGMAPQEAYHYQPPSRHHAHPPPEHEYGGSTSSSHHRSYKGLSASRSETLRRPPSVSRDVRYRSSPYSRPNK